MINKAAKHVNTVMQLLAIKAVIDADVFWDMANQEQKVPFANFKITNQGYITKNKLSQYAVEIFVYDKSLNDATIIADTIIEAIDESEYKWKFRGSESGYNYTDGREALCTLNYEFKI
jgi:hypothetical protein